MNKEDFFFQRTECYVQRGCSMANSSVVKAIWWNVVVLPHPGVYVVGIKPGKGQEGVYSSRSCPGSMAEPTARRMWLAEGCL